MRSIVRVLARVSAVFIALNLPVLQGVAHGQGDAHGGQAGCQSDWLPTFGTLAVGTVINALAVFDDGGGPALYAGGAFISAGGVAANSIAKWNGTLWSALGSGVNGDVSALTVFAWRRGMERAGRRWAAGRTPSSVLSSPSTTAAARDSTWAASSPSGVACR
ncbi:MAG TPA: hypothetical protein VK824_02385 [Planctomycetota bacterium]|nr:hypothetical protein [Planctomycetota bacterium]